ncbi:MAG: inositol monophosphatase [Patescibacteria group bacterium]
MSIYQKELETAVTIAREAGVIMLKYFDGDQQVEIKQDNTQVTIADKLANSLVIERLSKVFPEDGIIGEEESTAQYGMGRKWLCDPIDGTAAYVWGVPTAMFSLALVVDGKPVVGVAFDPFLNKMYTGIVGEKSLCNGIPLSVSDADLKTGTVAVSSSVKTFFSRSHLPKMANDQIRLASLNGAVYKSCLVARGKFVGYVEHGVNPHDMAAVHVIVECAGGKLTSLTGEELNYSQPFKGAIVSNGIVHEELVRYCA